MICVFNTKVIYNILILNIHDIILLNIHIRHILAIYFLRTRNNIQSSSYSFMDKLGGAATASFKSTAIFSQGSFNEHTYVSVGARV